MRPTRLAAALLAGMAGSLAAAPDAQAEAQAVQAAEPSAAQAEFFEKRVRPLLADRCFQCHSAASGKSRGGLRLDSAAGLAKGGDSGPAVVPGKPDESPLIKAVRRSEPDAVSPMPPDGKGKPLSPEEIKSLETWVRDGAFFPGKRDTAHPAAKHWAFQPVKRPAVPAVKAAAWPATDIDRFLLSRMEAAGLAPSSDADPDALCRRLHFAITGLPPTPGEVAAFTQSAIRNPQSAIEAEADRLLASPAFGERWARHWLDLVRYADGKGHEYDYEIEGAWRYRDYVVRAFNADVPYDRFVREHIAGDLLPARNDPETGRNEAPLATAWWNLGEAATAPVDLPNDEGDRLDNQIEVFGKAFSALTLGCARCHDHKFDPVSLRDYYGLFGILAHSPTLRTWANGRELDAAADRLRALRDRLDGLRSADLSQRSPGTVPPLSLGKSATLLADFAAGPDAGIPPGWLVAGYAEAIGSAGSALRGLPPGLWTGTLSRRLPAVVRSPVFTIDRDHVDVLVAGEDSTIQVVVANLQLIRSPIYDVLKKPVGDDKKKGKDKDNPSDAEPAPKWRWRRFDVGRWKGLRAHVEVMTGKVDATHRILHTQDTPRSRFGLRAVVLTDGDKPPVPESSVPELPPPSDAAAEVLREMSAAEKTVPAPERYLGVSEVDGRDLPIATRGDLNKPKPGATPRRAPEVYGLPHKPVARGSGRMELAEAVASPDNPLTSRVIVNRLWHHLFGRGIVPTVDNFGVMGEPPSHPELLDFLADRFVREHKWSLKRAIREIVTSRAWRLSSAAAKPAGDAAKTDPDPDNRLLSRFPLRRLEAEAIRDAMLAVAGTLDRKIGGPWIAVPHRLTGTGTGDYHPPNGPVDGERRRSLYLAVWRNFPCAFLEVFDRPPPSNTFGGRDVSNVPSQSLTLLNDPFVAGQAREWAKRVRSAEKSGEARVGLMFREALSRPPTDAETRAALALVGDDDKGWDDLALAIFNLKEFLHVR